MNMWGKIIYRMKRIRGKCSIYIVYFLYKFRICILFLFIRNIYVIMKYDIIFVYSGCCIVYVLNNISIFYFLKLIV